MKYKNGKNLIITVICAMFVLLISFSCVTIISSGKISEKEDQPQAAGTYTFGSESIDNDSDEYVNNNIFIINSVEGLKAFSISVSWGADGEPCDFYKKTVKLAKNLSPDSCPPIGSHWAWDDGLESFTTSETAFKGEFDGQGHTIQLTNSVRTLKTELKYISCGFFARVRDAKIHDLKLNYNLNVTAQKSGAIYMNNKWYDQYDDSLQQMGWLIGGVAGYAANSKIYNCIVDFTLTMKGNNANSLAFSSFKNKYIGGVVGYLEGNSSNIYDCYVQNFDCDIRDETTNVYTYLSGIANNDSQSDFWNIVINNGSLKVGVEDNQYYKWNTLLEEGPAEYREQRKAMFKYNFYPLVSNLNENCASLYCTALENTRFDFSNLKSNTWYVAPNDSGFNNGIPYIRGQEQPNSVRSEYSFIKVKAYEFVAGANGEVELQNNNYGQGGNSIMVVAWPNNDFAVPNMQTAVTNFQGVNIIADGNDGFECSNWTQSTRTDSYGNKITVYTANFVHKTYTIKFLPHAESSIQEIAEFTLTIDDSINIESGYLEGKTYISVNNQIIQYVPGKYYLLSIETDYDNYNLEIGNNNLIDFGDSGTIVNVTFVLELKSYEIDIS